jgi:hypothetical protein
MLTNCEDALHLQPGLPGGALTQHKPDTSAVASQICSFCYDRGQAKKPTNVGDLLLQSFELKHRNLTAEDFGTSEQSSHDALPAADEAGDEADAPKKVVGNQTAGKLVSVCAQSKV